MSEFNILPQTFDELIEFIKLNKDNITDTGIEPYSGGWKLELIIRSDEKGIYSEDETEYDQTQ